MKFHLIVIYCSLFLVILPGCDTNQKIIENVQVLFANNKIPYLNDSTFFLNIFSIIRYKDHFLISDLKANHILEINNDYRLEQSYGTTGRGPGEFLAAATIYVKNDTLFAIDNGNHRFNLFKLGDCFIRSIPYPKDIIPNLGKFLITNNNIFISTTSRDLPIVKLDLYGNIINRFGENPTSKALPIKKDFAYNRYHLLEDPRNENFFAINQEIPIVYYYNSDGKLLATFDFSDSPIFKNRLAYIATESIKQNKYQAHFIVVQDVCIVEDKMYLLYVDRVDNKDLCSNIIELDIKSFRIENIFKLENKNDKKSTYFCFCVVNDNSRRILAFDVFSNEIQVFTLNKVKENFTLPTAPAPINTK